MAADAQGLDCARSTRMIMGAAYPGLLAAQQSLMDPKFIRILIATGLLAGALLVGAIVVAFFDRWRKRRANETYTTHDQLTSFRLLYERGELSQEEYERIRVRLLAQLKASGTPDAAMQDEAGEVPTTPAEEEVAPPAPDPPAPPATG